MNVGYLGPLTDYSGYGEASRHHVAALHEAGANVIARPVRYSKESSDFGSIGDLAKKLSENTGEYKVKLLHTTPDEYPRFMEPGKHHIGLMYWETDRLPKDFVEPLNAVDEVWTASKANKEAFEGSGVTTPIHIFPQSIETEREWPEPYQIPDFEGYLFYSIFEWTDRKNPEALLRAYFEEFWKEDNIGLLIKTYFRNFTMQNRRMIKRKIELLKSEMGLAKYPPVFLYLDLMDRNQVMRLHQTGNCFVSTHRGEGWGIPQVEAALAGNPVISTGYGGCHEYFDKGSMLQVPYEMVPLRGMEHAQHWYTPEQKWAEVDSGALREYMRKAFSGSNTTISGNGQRNVKQEFNFATVGKAMSDRLKVIEERL